MRVYTDGACSGNPGPGGWAWAIDGGSPSSATPDYANGSAEQTTNQRMELQAVLEAVNTISGSIEIVSDSTYVVNCFKDRWYEGWIKRGWRTSAKKPVANRDIWEPLVTLYLERKDELSFTWVKGHSGDRMNDVVDQLAVDACKALQAEMASAAATPSVAVPRHEVPWESSRAVWIVGTTEPDNDQRGALGQAIDGLNPARDIAVSGLRRGVELEGAERARLLGVPLGVVLPFADPAHKWPPADRDRFNALVGHAEWVVTLDGKVGAPGDAVEARNVWMQDAVAGAIVIGDPALARTLDAADVSVVTIS